MSINKTKEKFKNKEIEKHQYIEEMFMHHNCLFDYREAIKLTDIKEICISDEGVQFTTRIDEIKFLCEYPDKRIPPIEVINFNFYEEHEAAMLLQLIQPEFTVLDIGANIGWYSLSIAKRYPNTKIYAFEPLSPIFANLQRNIELNNIENIIPYNIGFANKSGSTNFYYDPTYCARTSEANLADEAVSNTVEAHVVKLDDFALEKSLPSIDFIKCDVEGAELFVYQGGKKLIERDKPIIFSEMLRKWAAKFDYHPNDIINMMAELGYSCYYIVRSRLVKIKLIDDLTEATNFIFLNDNKHSVLEKELTRK